MFTYRMLVVRKLALLSSAAVSAAVMFACAGEVDDGPGASAPSSSGEENAPAASDDSGGTTDDADTKDDVEAPPPGPTNGPFACPAGAPAIVAGVNTIKIAGVDRKFWVDLPKTQVASPAVLLSFHGFGQATEDWRNAVKLDPDAVPATPMIVVTPDDRGLQPPAGLDWDIVNGRADTPNPDITLVESILGCLTTQKSMDASRIYAFGFSAGSVFASMLHSRHPQLFAAIVAASGAWMNDAEQANLVNPLLKPLVKWKWAPLDPKDSGNVLLSHGGPNDKVAFDALPIEAAAQKAIPFLRKNKREVVDCPHTGGHTLHPEISMTKMAGYLAAHRLGTPAPGAAALAGLPSSCKLVP